MDRFKIHIKVERIIGRNRRQMLLEFEADTSRERVFRMNRFLNERFPEAFEEIYGTRT